MHLISYSVDLQIYLTRYLTEEGKTITVNTETETPDALKDRWRSGHVLERLVDTSAALFRSLPDHLIGFVGTSIRDN